MYYIFRKDKNEEINRMLKYRKLIVRIRNEACMYKYLYAKSFKYSNNNKKQEREKNYILFLWVISVVS